MYTNRAFTCRYCKKGPFRTTPKKSRREPSHCRQWSVEEEEEDYFMVIVQWPWKTEEMMTLLILWIVTPLTLPCQMRADNISIRVYFRKNGPPFLPSKLIMRQLGQFWPKIAWVDNQSAEFTMMTHGFSGNWCGNALGGPPSPQGARAQW